MIPISCLVQFTRQRCLLPSLVIASLLVVFLQEQTLRTHFPQQQQHKQTHQKHKLRRKLQNQPEKTIKNEKNINQINQIGSPLPKNILILVMTSRSQFPTRVSAILKTWANESNIPPGVQIRFVVGDHETEQNTTHQNHDHNKHNNHNQTNAIPAEYAFATEAGLTDLNKLIILHHTLDDEYPPVNKIASAIKRTQTFFAYDGPDMFHWVFKVDDDAYVNLNNVVKFLQDKDPNEHAYWGRRGIGREQDLAGIRRSGFRSYCLGGPGYIMSRATIVAVASSMDSCLAYTEKSRDRDALWHSDILVGLCVARAVPWFYRWPQNKGDCAFGEDFDWDFHNTYSPDGMDKMSNYRLSNLLSYHPLKENHMMLQMHTRSTTK